jgi:hypothetical protein
MVCLRNVSVDTLHKGDNDDDDDDDNNNNNNNNRVIGLYRFQKNKGCVTGKTMQFFSFLI